MNSILRHYMKFVLMYTIQSAMFSICQCIVYEMNLPCCKTFTTRWCVAISMSQQNVQDCRSIKFPFLATNLKFHRYHALGSASTSTCLDKWISIKARIARNRSPLPWHGRSLSAGCQNLSTLVDSRTQETRTN